MEAGLSLTDEGFDPTVLIYWRNRLRASGRPDRIFDAVREVVAETGVLATRTARVLDSTVLDDQGERFAGEVDSAALVSGALKHPAQGGDRAGVLVGGDQPHPDQPAGAP